MQEHYQMLFSYAVTLCKEASLAEDVVQETFVTAYQQLNDFDCSRDFGAWIRGIARNI